MAPAPPPSRAVAGLPTKVRRRMVGHRGPIFAVRFNGTAAASRFNVYGQALLISPPLSNLISQGRVLHDGGTGQGELMPCFCCLFVVACTG